MGSIPDVETKIPHALGQLSPCTTTTEPMSSRARAQRSTAMRACALQWRGAPDLCNQRKATCSNKDTVQPKSIFFFKVIPDSPCWEKTASAVSVEGKYTFTDRQPTCYTGMDQSLGERAHEDARMGWIQESRGSINRALQSALWKRTKSRASAQSQAGLSQNISGN